MIFTYSINNKIISCDDTHKDLGVIMSSDLHWRPHYQFIIPKAYKMLGLLRRVFSSVMCVSLKHSLYLSFVHSKLLYCSPLWRPHLLTNIKSLETVQRRATKFIMDDASMNYRDCLLRLNMLPLMMEFETADILFLIKSIKYPSIHFNITHFISFSSSNTRSSSAFKIQHKRTKSNVQGHFYLNRIPRLWNSLPSLDTNLSTSTVNSKLRQFFWNHFISNFDSHNPCTFHYLCPCLNCLITMSMP